MSYKETNKILKWHDIEPIKESDTQQVITAKEEYAMLAELELYTDIATQYITIALDKLEEVINGK